MSSAQSSAGNSGLTNATTSQVLKTIGKINSHEGLLADDNCNCSISNSTTCGKSLSDWVKEDEKGIFSSRRSTCDNNLPDLKTFLDEKDLSDQLFRYNKSLDKNIYSCSPGPTNNPSLVVAKSVYAQTRFEEAQKSILNQVAAIDSMEAKNVLDGVDCHHLGSFIGLQYRCASQQTICKSRPSDFTALAKESVIAEKNWKVLNQELSNIKSYTHSKLGREDPTLEYSPEQKKRKEAIEATLDLIKQNYPWIFGDIYQKTKKDVKNSTGFAATVFSEEEAASTAIHAQLNADRNTLLDQLTDNRIASECLLKDSPNCKLDTIQEIFKQTPPLTFISEKPSEAEKSMKFQQCLFDQKVKDDRNKEIAKGVGLTLGTIALTAAVPETFGGTAEGATAFASRAAVAFRNAMVASNQIRAGTAIVVDASQIPSGISGAAQSCLNEERKIQVSQNKPGAQLCPGYSNDFSQSIRKFDGCVANSVMTALGLGGSALGAKAFSRTAKSSSESLREENVARVVQEDSSVNTKKAIVAHTVEKDRSVNTKEADAVENDSAISKKTNTFQSGMANTTSNSRLANLENLKKELPQIKNPTSFVEDVQQRRQVWNKSHPNDLNNFSMPENKPALDDMEEWLKRDLLEEKNSYKAEDIKTLILGIEEAKTQNYPYMKSMDIADKVTVYLNERRKYTGTLYAFYEKQEGIFGRAYQGERIQINNVKKNFEKEVFVLTTRDASRTGIAQMFLFKIRPIGINNKYIEAEGWGWAPGNYSNHDVVHAAVLTSDSQYLSALPTEKKLEILGRIDSLHDPRQNELAQWALYRLTHETFSADDQLVGHFAKDHYGESAKPLTDAEAKWVFKWANDNILDKK